MSQVFIGHGGARLAQRLELGSESYSTLSRYNGKPAAGLAIKPATGANALDTVAAVKKKIQELSAFFPPGVKAVYPSWKTSRA